MTTRNYVRQYELVSEMVSDPEAEHLQTVLDSLDRIEELVHDTLALAREGKDVGKRDSVELGALARSAWELVNPTNATLVVENDRDLSADRSRLRQLFESMFQNVTEHCREDVTVTVRGTDDGFSVADDGPGLSPEIAESLFDGEFEADRLGLGLLTIERVVSYCRT